MTEKEINYLKSLEYPFYYDGITWDEFEKERAHFMECANNLDEYVPLYKQKENYERNI